MNAQVRWSTALPDWEKRIVAGDKMIPELPIWKERADKALRIFKRLRVKDILGRPNLGKVCPEWVFDLVYAIFGTADPETKRQLVKFFFLMIAKKNSKSTLAAGIMMTALIMNERHDGEFTILAPTKEIAGNSFDPAMGMVELDEDLSALFKCNANYREITHREMGSTLKVVAADADTVGGIKSIATLVDELWLFGKKASFDNILSEAEGALASRPEGFFMYLTTQSDEPPAGSFKRILERMRRIRDAEVSDPSALPLIFEFPKSIIKADQYREDERLWRIPNPNLGYSVDVEFLRTQLSKAQDGGAASLNLFLAKHFNVEIGGRLRADGWVGAQFWPRGAGKLKSLDDLIDRSDVVTIGIDGGGLDDLLGLTVMGRDRETGKWLIWCRAWAHEVVLERRKSEAAKINDLVKEGTVTIVSQIGDDLEALAEIVAKVNRAGLLPAKSAVGVDRAGVDDFGIRLMKPDVGLTNEQIEGIGQGWTLSGTIKTVERKLAAGEIEHEGSALMSWAVGNALVELRGSATTITKAASGTAKIDPLMSTFDAAYLMGLDPQADGAPEIIDFMVV